MTPQLQAILNAIKNNTDLSESEREALVKSIKEADKTQSLSQFKLDRLEKDRNTLTIMLQESIEDLQKKSRAIEAQNRELEIESSLEKVRTVAMGMRRRDDMLDVCQVIARQLESLKVREIRNVQTAIFDENKGTYANYEFYVKHDKSLVTEVDYKDHPVAKGFADQMLKGPNQVWIYAFKGKEVTDWLNYQKSTNVFIDTYLENADTLNYYWSSLGPVAIGTSAYVPLNEEEVELFKRFRNVFELAYRRYLDIEKAEAQAREAQIEAALERVRSQSMAMRTSEELKNVVKELRKQIGLLGQQELDTCVIQLYDESPDYIHSLASMKPTESNEEILDFDRPIPKKGLLIHEEALQAYSSGRKDYIILNEKRKLEQWIGFIKETYPDIYSVFISTYGAKPEDVPSFWSFSDFNGGSLLMVTLTPPTDVSRALLRRFANVFGQAYRRYVDIKQAEAQARESQIQLAMERVRARTMAMQKSEELADVAELLFKQVNNLGIRTWTTGFNVWSEDNNFYTDYITNPQGGFMPPYTIDAAKLPVTIEVSNAKKRGDEFLVNYEEGESLAETYRQLSKFGEKQFKAILESGFEFPSHQYEHFVFGSKVSLLFITYDPVPEAHEIFKRFGKVFEQTYTRFLDLQKAEAQARESQIEAALERVRSRSIGMQKSEELKEVIQVVYEQFVHLNILIDHTGFIIDYKARDDMHIWLADRHEVPSEVIIPYFDCAHWNSFNEAKEKGMDFFVNQLSFEEKNRFYQDLFKLIPDVPEETLEFYYSCPGLAISTVLLENVGLYIENFSAIPYSDEENNTLMRFGKVFQQTYTRFVDLQKAEAQARESQIEAVLERIRSRTMAMQKSGELTDVAGLLFAQVSALDIKTWTAGFNVWSEDNDSYIDYITSPNGGFIEPYTVYTETAEALTDISDARKSGVEFDVQYVEGEKIKQLYRALTKLGEKQFEIMLQDGVRFPSHQYEHFVFGSKVSLMFITYEPVPEAHDIFKRLGKVFEQTYTRFLDLQKAEEQARESQIEAALERVRSKAMAMHKADDLNPAVAVVFEELDKLDLGMLRCGIGILDKVKRSVDVWTTSVSDKGTTVQVSGDESMDIHPLLQGAFDAWLKQSDFSYTLQGEDLFQYYRAVGATNIRLPQSQTDVTTQYYYVATFDAGGLFAFREAEFSEEGKAVMKRFANVFNLTYKRFLDLQKAEAQAREARIEAALERVRSRTLAMQRSDELAEAAAVLFKQLILLGIEPNRLYINIIKDETGEAEFWITDEDGSKISMAYSANMNANPTFKKMYEGWKEQKKSLVIDMHGKELEEYFKHLSSLNVPFRGGLSQKRRLQYIAYFSKGFIGMASPDQQPSETMQLLERFAAAFNLTFTRFNDLKIAEAHALQAEQDLVEIKAARKKAEDALTELQATQKQLVQSEKMASLGELTAGIAHEIQNPLNFVNNFSDVSNELLEEMKIELEKGNTKDVIAIVDDVKQNLEKILHHGKRADAIVKGMLQHSRTSSSQKELTDINALADEYLRLAYHGLRAKDKSFNAAMKTDFDETIGKINIVPQDIGRAVLNLITNAFYVVAEKKKQLPEGYEPRVTVKTKKEGDKVLVSVKDNGKGIPQKVLEKIFQPFFTTKPTGQGTGLGLSLAYDIVKAHGGEIKVETKEGVGSEFVIQLPV
jgi:signal transduction histidine kinase